jgi:hypothetical protein
MDGHAQTKRDLAELLKALTSDPALSPNQAAVLAMAARIVGRTSLHLSNIPSAVGSRSTACGTRRSGRRPLKDWWGNGLR